MEPAFSTWIIPGLFSYLVGSFPTAYLVVRWRTGQDLRRLGDGNVGAENAARVLGVRAGVFIGGVDIAKGVLVILLTRLWIDSLPAELVAGVAVVLGHSWPVFLKGHGGRGAATALGVLLALMPYPAVPLALVMLLLIFLTRSTTRGLAFFYGSNLLVGLLTRWLLPESYQPGWPLDYSYPALGYALALPVLVGLIHWLSRWRVPGR